MNTENPFTLAEVVGLCGWPVYALLGLGALAVPASVALSLISLVSTQRRVGKLSTMILALMGIAAVVLGALGRTIGVSKTEALLPSVYIQDQMAVRLLQGSQARGCLAAGIVAAAVLAAAACLAFSRTLVRRLTKVTLAGGLAVALGVLVLGGSLALNQHRLAQMDYELASPRCEQVETWQSVMERGQAEATSILQTGLLASMPLLLTGIALLMSASRSAATP